MKQKTKRTQARILQMLAWILSRFSLIVSRLSFFDRRISNIEQRATTQSFFNSRYSFVVLRTTTNEQRTTNIIRKGAQTLFFVCALLLGSVQGWGQTTDDYRTRVANQTWATANTWERYNGSAWVTATAAPTSANGAILVQHNVTVGASVTVDQVTVTGTSVITISNNQVLTIANGTGDDMTYSSSGNVSYGNGNSSITLDAGALLVHTSNASIPTQATFTSTSTIEVRGTNTPTVSSFNRTFANLIWNSTGSLNLTTQSSFNIQAGNTFEIKNGNVYVSSAHNSSMTRTWAGDLNINGGTFWINYRNTTSASDVTLTVNQLTITSGTLNMQDDNGNIGCDAILNVNAAASLSNGTLNMMVSNNVSNNTTSTLNLRGNFSWSGGTITRSNTQATGPNTNINFTATSGTQTFSQTLGNITHTSQGRGLAWGEPGASIVNINYGGTSGTAVGLFSPTGSVTVSCSGVCTFPSAYTLAASRTHTVNSGSTLAVAGTLTNSGTFNVDGSFQLNSGGFAQTNNFVYGASGTLIFNSATSYGVQNAHVYWPTTNGPVNVTILQGGITMGVSGTAANRTVTGTFQTAAAVTLLNGGTTSTLTLNGTCRINANGSFNQAPVYGSSSTLEYNTGSTYGRGAEWNATGAGTIGSTAGYPNNVTITGNTTLNLPNTSATARALAGNLTVNSGSNFYADFSSVFPALTVAGNLVSDGAITTGGVLTVSGNITFNGSYKFGNDVYVAGNYTIGASASPDNNGKAVFFNKATGDQVITRTGGGAVFFDYLVINKATSGNVQINSSPETDVTINTTTGNVLQINNNGALDLNGRKLNLNNDGGSIYVNGARSITSGVSGGSVEVAGLKSVANNSGTGTLTFGPNVTINLNAGGRMDFGFSSGSISTVQGTLSLNSTTNCFVNTNPPNYAAGSTLIYGTGGTYGRSVEWSTTNGAGYPSNVTINNGSGLDLGNGGTGTARQMSGNLTVNGGLYMDFGSNDMTQSLTVLGNLVIGASGQLSLSDVLGGDIDVKGNWTNNGGTFSPKSRTVTFSGTSDQTITRTGGETFDFLTVNKTGGNLILANNITCNRTLTLTNGDIVTGSNKVTIASGGDITSGTNASHIVGNLERHFATGTNVSRLFPIGDGSNYSPATIILGSVTTAGTITLRTDNSNPYTATYGLSSSKYINRYWTPTNATTVFTGASIQFNYVTGDLIGSAVAGNIRAAGYNGTAWIYPSTSTAANQFTISSITNATIANYYTGGECGTPSFTPSSNTPICVGATLNLSSGTISGGAGAYTYSWTGPNGFSSTSQNPSRTNVQTADAGTYTLTVSDAASCSSSENATLIVTTPPNAGTLSGTQAICLAGTTTFSSDGNSNGAWTSSNTGIATVNSSTGVVTGVAAGTATITYTVTGTDGCSNASNTRTVTVNARPSAPTGTNGSRCGTGTVNLSATAGAGETIDWYAAPSGGSALSSGSTSYTTSNISTTTIYYAEARNTTTGCVSATRTAVTASVNATPSAPGIGTITQPTCAVPTGSVQLTGLPASGTWTVTITPGGGTLTGNGSTGTVNSLDDATSYTFTVTSADGCVSASSASVAINARPEAPLAPTGADGGRCGTGTVNIAAYAQGVNQVIDWYANSTGGTALLSNNTQFTTPSISSTTIYYAEARFTTGGGCVSATRTPVTAVISANPTITLNATASAVSYGVSSSSVAYTATSNSPVTYSISWSSSPTNSFVPVNDAALSSSPISLSIPGNTNAGTYTGNVTVKNAIGCESSGASFTITVNPASLTITGVTADNKTYDGTTAATLSGTPAYSGLQYGASFEVSGSPTATFNTAAVGNNKPVSVLGYTAPNANYTVTQPSLTANIEAAPLTITAEDVYKTTGLPLSTPVSSAAFSAEGLVNSETIGTVTISYTNGHLAGAAAGTYANAVVPSAATGGTFVASNYAITYNSADLFVGSFKVATQPGNWSNTATWGGSAIPTAGDVVQISGNRAVTVDIPNAVCASLQLGIAGSASYGDLGFATTGSPKLTVGGSVTIGGSGNSGNESQYPCYIVFQNGSTLEADQIILTRSTGSKRYGGRIDMALGGTLITGSITLGTSSVREWIPGSGTGTVVMSQNSTLPSSIFTTYRNLTINSGVTTTSGVSFSVTGNMTVNGTFVPGATTHVISGAGALTGSGEVDVTRTTTPVIDHFSDQYTITNKSLSGLTVDYRGANNQSILATTYGRLHTSGSGTKTLLGNTTINTALQIGASTTLIAGSTTIDLKGNFINNGTFTAGASTLTLSGTGTQNINESTNFHNLTVTNTASNITMENGITIGISGAFTPNGTSFGSGNSITYNFNGGSGQNIPAFNFFNLQLNGGGDKTLTGAVSVSNVLTFSNGKLLLGNNNLTIGNASGVAGGSASSYVVTNGTGLFRRTVSGAAAYTFPIGSSTHYNPITYNWSSAPGITQLDATYIASTATTGTGLPTTVFGCEVASDILNNGYWNFAATGTMTNNPTITVTRLGHNNAAERFSAHGIIRRDNSASDWGVAGLWANNGNTPVDPANTGTVTLTQSALNGFGDIAIAKGAGQAATGLWIGAVNGEAENSANWGCNTVPDYTIDVVIPRNVPNQPTVISGDITCKSITIQQGALLRIVTDKVISIANGGHFTNNGTFQTVGSVGTVAFLGTGTVAGSSTTTFHDLQLNGATTFSRVPNIHDNLIMNNGASVSASPGYSNAAVLVYNNTNTMTTGSEWTGNANNVSAGAPSGVTIQNGGTVELSGNRSVPGTLTLTSGTLSVGAHTLSLFDQVTITGGSFTSGAAGTVLYARNSNGQQIAAGNYGNLTFSSSNKVLPSSGTIGIGGVFTPGTGSHTTTNSTISFNGSSSQMIPAFNYHNLTVGGSNVKTAGAALSIPGNMVIAGTFDAGAYSHLIEGNWINNGTFTHGGGTIQFDGTTTISGTSENTFNNVLVTGELTAPNANMNVVGNWTINGGAFTPGNGTVTFNNTQAPQNISGTAAEFNFNNLTMANTGQTVILQGSPVARKSLNLNGNMTLSSGTFNAIFTDVNMNGGNWTNNGATFSSGGSKVLFNSTTQNQSINGTAQRQTFERLTMNKVGRTLSLGGSTIRLIVTDTFALAAGTYDAGTTDSLRIGKNWIITGGTFAPGLATVAFDGETEQNIPAQTYHKLSIQGSGVKTAQGNITLNDELNIQSGKAMDMGTFQLNDGGNLNTTGSGTLRTKNIGATPLPNGKTWSFGVSFEGADVQTVSNGTYNGGLTINNSGNGAAMNGNVTAAAVTLSSGDLSISSNTLTLNGSFSGSSNNALRGSATSNLTVGNGAAAGILYFRNDGTFNFIKDLRFMSAATATLGNRLNVTAGAEAGKVKVEANSSLASNGNLVLKSDTLGTAFVDEILNCTSCSPITGEVEVERSMPNRRTWRLVTIPVTGSYTLRQQLTRQGPGAAVEYPAPFCGGQPAPASTGYGTMITAHSMSSCGNAAAVGADHITNGGSSSVRRYTHINGTASWASNNTTNAINYNAVPDQEGYLVFIRGDRSQLGSGSNATTFRFKGTLRQGNAASTNSINAAYGVVSNPYAAPINVVDVFANGTGNENKFARNVWVWDGDKIGSNGFGGYRSLSYDGVSGYTCADCGTNAEGQQYLTMNSGQAFMLQRKSDVSTAVALTVKEEDKVSGSGNILTMRRFDARTTQSTVPSFRVRLFRANGANLETFVDATTARFNNLYKADPNEEYDVYKYNNNADENISLVRNNKYLAIESRPVPKANDTLYIPFWSVTNRGYALSIQTENLATTGLTAELIDSFTTTRTPIPLNGTNFVYPFTVSSNAASRSLSRFRVVFTPGNSLPVTFTNVRAYPKSNGVNVEWDVVNEENLSHYEIERSTDGNQFNKIAVKQAVNQTAVSYEVFDKKPASGVNYYRIRSVDQDGTFRFSATMRVSLGRNEQGIDVYPTKVSDNNINIALTEQPAGAYNIQLVNSIGQVAFSKRIVHSGGTSTQTLNIGSENLPGGIYYLNIDLENGMKKTVKLFIQR